MKIVFTFFILLISLPGISQIKIKGTIHDSETNKPIPYVNIWVEGEIIGTTSDLQGRFTLKKVPVNKFILFSAIGYKTYRVSSEESS
jgi:carboxypeptidase-like protein